MKSFGVRRAVASLLLLYAAADLSIPGFCPFEFELSRLGRSAEALTLPAVSAIHDSGDPSFPVSSSDDDCYCCSSRIQLMNPISLAIPEPVEYCTVLPKFRILAGFSPDYDHPPRLF